MGSDLGDNRIQETLEQLLEWQQTLMLLIRDLLEEISAPASTGSDEGGARFPAVHPRGRVNSPRARRPASRLRSWRPRH
jgi:hypothetical protein